MLLEVSECVLLCMQAPAPTHAGSTRSLLQDDTAPSDEIFPVDVQVWS